MGAEPCLFERAVAEQSERHRVIQEQLPQVRSIAQRIHARLPRHVELDDLVQTGVVGLLDAVQKFDPARKVELGAYARLRIQGAILDSLRLEDPSPRLLRQQARRAESARQHLMAVLRRTPTAEEIAREMDMTAEAWDRVRAELQALETISLDAIETGENNARDAIPRSHEENPYDGCARGEIQMLLAQALAKLTPRRRRLLILYYFEGLTMKQVGERLGVCESRISQMHSTALAAVGVQFKALSDVPHAKNPMMKGTTIIPFRRQGDVWGAPRRREFAGPEPRGHFQPNIETQNGR